MTSSRCSSSSLAIFSWFLPKKYWSRQSAFQWIRIVPLFSLISFFVFIRSGIHKSLLSKGKKQLASLFILTYRYIDDVLSMDNQEFENYLGQMYTAELEIKDITGSITSVSYLDLLLSIRSDGQLHTSIYNRCDDFNFHITKFPFLSRNIPSAPAYCIFISQLIRYAGACSSYGCFILMARRLSSKLRSNRDISWITRNRPSGSVMVNTGVVFNNMKPLAHGC